MIFVARAWPEVSSIDQKWKGLQKPLFQLLLAEKVVHTQAQGGKWVTLRDAIIHRQLWGDQNDLLLRILLSVNLPSVTVPNHVLGAIDIYAPGHAEVTPAFIRSVLRQAPSSYTSLTRRDKLLLLQFSLSDGNFKDLDGLQLLPLANETFAKFQHRAKPVFIALPEHPQELLPGLGDRFLDTTVSKDILQCLQTATFRGRFLFNFVNPLSHRVPSFVNCPFWMIFPSSIAYWRFTMLRHHGGFALS